LKIIIIPFGRDLSNPLLPPAGHTATRNLRLDENPLRFSPFFRLSNRFSLTVLLIFKNGHLVHDPVVFGCIICLGDLVVLWRVHSAVVGGLPPKDLMLPAPNSRRLGRPLPLCYIRPVAFLFSTPLRNFWKFHLRLGLGP